MTPVARNEDRQTSGVEARDRSTRVHRGGHDVGIAEAHERFGGVDIPATLAGMLAAVGTFVVLSGIAAGAGSIGYQSGLDEAEELSLGGFIAGLVVLFLAFLVGGWVAGRMARYDGGRNGLVTALWFLLLVAGLAALGAWAGERYEDELADLDLPRWFEDNARTTTAIITGLVALAVVLLAGFLGGTLGGRYHRRADEVIAATRDGGVGSVHGGEPEVADRRGAADPDVTRVRPGDSTETEAYGGERMPADSRADAPGRTVPSTGQVPPQGRPESRR